jgi:hypothetical protein
MAEAICHLRSNRDLADRMGKAGLEAPEAISRSKTRPARSKVIVYRLARIF